MESFEKEPDVRRSELIRKEIALVWNGSHPKLAYQKRSLLKRQEEKLVLLTVLKSNAITVVDKLYDKEAQAIQKEFNTQKNQLRDKWMSELIEKKRKWTEEREWLSLSSSNGAGTDAESNHGGAGGVSNESGGSGLNNRLAVPANYKNSRKLRNRQPAISSLANVTTGATTGPGANASGSNNANATSGSSQSQANALKLKKTAASGPSITHLLKDYEIEEDVESILVLVSSAASGSQPNGASGTRNHPIASSTRRTRMLRHRAIHLKKEESDELDDHHPSNEPENNEADEESDAS